tara:strand:+ start:679 stop:2007 length:1329 start_codon:yes stop_codon:yes gene_type:complete
MAHVIKLVRKQQPDESVCTSDRVLLLVITDADIHYNLFFSHLKKLLGFKFIDSYPIDLYCNKEVDCSDYESVTCQKIESLQELSRDIKFDAAIVDPKNATTYFNTNWKKKLPRYLKINGVAWIINAGDAAATLRSRFDASPVTAQVVDPEPFLIGDQLQVQRFNDDEYYDDYIITEWVNCIVKQQRLFETNNYLLENFNAFFVPPMLQYISKIRSKSPMYQTLEVLHNKMDANEPILFFIPYNINKNHWILIIVQMNPKKHSVKYHVLDPLDSAKSRKAISKLIDHKLIYQLFSFDRKYLTSKLDQVSDSTVRHWDVPQQSDFVSCGPFVCWYLQRLLLSFMGLVKYDISKAELERTRNEGVLARAYTRSYGSPKDNKILDIVETQDKGRKTKIATTNHSIEYRLENDIPPMTNVSQFRQEMKDQLTRHIVTHDGTFIDSCL